MTNVSLDLHRWRSVAQPPSLPFRLSGSGFSVSMVEDRLKTIYAPRMTSATLSSITLTLLSTPATLAVTSYAALLTVSPTACVAFRFCAIPIQASSRVNLSSLFSASSMSVLLINFFTYFSEYRSVNPYIFVQRILTQSALLHLFRCDPKNRENLDHYLNDHIHHFRDRLHFGVDLQSSENQFDPLKNVDKSIFASPNVLDCLRNVLVIMVQVKLLRMLT